jgi:hypothetical protein
MRGKWVLGLILSLVPALILIKMTPLHELICLMAGSAGAMGIGLAVLRSSGLQKCMTMTEMTASSFILGIPLSGLIITGLSFAGFESYLVVTVPLIFTILYALWRSRTIANELRCAVKRETISFGILILLSTAIIAQPYLNVGKETAQGKAYRAYFDHDFLVHLAVTTELAHGNIPPRNPYFGTESLHYYWLAFQFPAMCCRLGNGELVAERILLGSNFLIALSFVTLLFFLLRSVTHRVSTASFTVFAVLFCGSYEGFFYLCKRLMNGQDFSAFRMQNLDGLTRWLYGPPQVDTLFRGLLFTPQHLTALGLTLLAAVYYLRCFQTSQRHISLLMTSIVFTVTGCSIFIGGVFLLWMGILELYVSVKRYVFPFFRWLEYALVIGISLGLWFVLDMISLHSGQLQFGAQILSPTKIFMVMFLNFGLLPVFALAGIVLSWKRQPGTSFGTAILLFLTPVFIFLFTISGYENEFGLRGGFILFIASAVGLAQLFSRLYSPGKWIIGMVAICLLPGFLSTLMDTYNAKDVTNQHFTLYVDQSARTALDQIKMVTLPDHIVQSEPEQFSEMRNGILPNLIPPFAERCLYVGRTYYAGQFQIGKSAASERVKQVQDLLDSPHALELYYSPISPHIDYWLLDSHAALRNPSGLRKFLDDRFVDSIWAADQYHLVKEVSTKLPDVLQTCLEISDSSGMIPESAGDPIYPEEDPAEMPYAVLQPVSGFEQRVIEHDWIFSRQSVIADSCFISVHNPSVLQQIVPASAEEVILDLYFIDCGTAPEQTAALWIENTFVVSVMIKSGWHRYRIPIPVEIPRETELLWTFVCRKFQTPAEYCIGSSGTEIGATGIHPPGPILVRTGPAPRKGFYGDVFYNGKNLSPHQSGYNLVPIPPDTPPAVFDVISNEQDNRKMWEWIHSLKENQIVCGVALSGAENHLTNEGWKALTLLGLSCDPRDHSGIGHAFIGIKGSDPGMIPELIPEQKADFIYVGSHQGDTPFGFVVRRMSFCPSFPNNQDL